MSRTYRRVYPRYVGRLSSIPPHNRGDFDKVRDGKKWYKPPKWFKTMNRRGERAKVNNEIRGGNFDHISKFPRSDVWNWV